MEALQIEKILVPAKTPIFTHYGGDPRWWNWWGHPYPYRNHRNRRQMDWYDIEYRNTENQLHRIYGPAYISTIFKIEVWYKEGKMHRENGPCYTRGPINVWMYEGKPHRLDGPAVIELAGPKQYWIHGVRMCRKEYEKEIARRKRKGLL